MAELVPATVEDVCAIVAEAAGAGTKLEIRGGGSKAEVGAPDRDTTILSTARLRGIIDYDPAELVLTVHSGTSLSEVEALVAGQEQMLAFEPFDHGPFFGRPIGKATIGGVVAAAVAGSRRLSAGGCRDHLLGFEAVSGRGERFVGGAKVVKNVTGYDLPKVMAGSWGRLAALTQLTLKVLPRARTQATIIVEGLSPAQAQASMALAMRSQAEVAAAAHLPARTTGAKPMTAFRIAGFGPSVAARAHMLEALLHPSGRIARLDDQQAQDLWNAVRYATPLGTDRPLWRVNVPPSGACPVIAALEAQGADWLFDWAGGLIWLAFDGDAALVARAAEAAGGHAALARAPAALRAVVPAFHREAPGVVALSERIRRAFDPCAVFETGRFLDRPHAN